MPNMLRIKLLALSIALSGIVMWPSAPAVCAAEDPSLNDAALNDVFFLDGSCGWAVGDQGVIWHTEDGGRHWDLQPSGTVCSLRSVWFVDRRNGWAVGGQGLPYSAGSRGLVLGTIDGGQSWQPLSWDQFPRLVRVQFVNGKAGWAWGETSEYYPSGLINSDSGGRMWAPAAGSAGAAWLAGFLSGPESGVLAGSGGATAMLVNRNVTPVSVGSLGSRAIRSLRASNDGTCWAVADGGIVLRSSNRGVNWSVLTSGMPEHAPAIFDWRGVYAIGRTVWVVGRPGSVVLTSNNAGASWETLPTGQALPLEGLWFQDRQHGWAVGALGTILATSDGGASWRVQRRGGERAAMLSVHGAPSSAPLLPHVQLGAEQGYLTVDLSMIGSAPELGKSGGVGGSLRLSDAVRIAGGAHSETEWRFPAVPFANSLNQVLDEWNRQHEGLGLEDLERRLVIALRTWRPDVVITDALDPADGAGAASALVSQALERSFQSAAEAAAFPELLESARLEPWRVTKLYAATRHGNVSNAHVDSSEISRREEWAGRPIEDRANLALSLLAESFATTPFELAFRRIATRLPDEKADGSFMAGISLEPGGPARRRLPNPVEISDAQRRAVQTRRNLLAILNRAESQPVMAQQMNAQVGGLLRDLPPDQAGSVLYNLARLHFSQGRWSECAEVLERLLAENAGHLAAAEAERWLIQFYASSEARHRERTSSSAGQSFVNPQGPLKSATQNKGSASQPEPPSDPALSEVRLTVDQQSRTVGGLGTGIAWSRGAVETAKRLMQTSPLVWSEPQVQFALAVAQRSLGNTKESDKFHTTFGLGREASPWSDAARSERWIRDHQGMPPKPVVVSQRVFAAPRLDGTFDDPAWKSAPPITLQNVDRPSDDSRPTQVRVAHDHQFLYIAIVCSSPDAEAAPPVRPRTRDADLSAHDHVDLYLDLDRDYSTFYHLSADERGCVFEDCWGDKTWDPTWYVASQSDEKGYRLEVAIPLAELTNTAPAEGTVWAFNAVRVVPGSGVWSWSRPAGIGARPEGMGLLMFSEGRTVAPTRPAVAN
jgi:photosystem II stability/assembly factor-like uncharacterized protein